MKLIWYEWVKLGQKRLFWVLAAALLAGNLLTMYTFEKNTDTFFYVHEQSEAYQAFQAGDASVNANNWYQADVDAQTAYMQSYDTFIDEMEARAEQMSQTAIFAEQDSYVHRNLFQTCADFAHLSGLELEMDNCFGLRSIAGYGSGVLFLLIFLAVLTYFIIFYERDMGLTLLLKGNRYGHMPLALSKLAVMFGATILYTLIQEVGTVLFFGWLYGYGDMGRPIQSASLFRNCAHLLTVGQGLTAIVLIRIVVAVLFVCVLFCVGMCIKNEAAAVVSTIVVLGGEYLLSKAIPISSGLNWLKCVNPFYSWDMGAVLGEYLNLNLFGWPVNKGLCAIAATAGVAILLPVTGVLVFDKTCQVRANSYWERVMQWIRARLSFLSRRISLLYYEFYKMMFQQKKDIVFVLMLAWCIYEIVGAFGPAYYATARDAAYRYYIELLHGPVTENTMTFMEEEEARLNGLWREMMELSNDSDGDSYVRMLIIQAELERLEDGFYAVQQQLDTLKEKPGELEKKYLMDEQSYIGLWWDTDQDLSLWFVGSAALLFFICGLHTMDEKKKMLPLLRSTQNGRRKLEQSKTVCALLCTLTVFVVTEFPLLLRYYRVDHFATVGQHLCDFTQIAFANSAPLWALLIGTFALKAMSFLAVCLGGIELSKITKNEPVTMLIGVGVVGMLTIVLHHFDLDVNVMLIKFLQ